MLTIKLRKLHPQMELQQIDIMFFTMTTHLLGLKYDIKYYNKNVLRLENDCLFRAKSMHTVW